MFDIGFTEILIVGVVALIVLGPERLPSALRTAGLWMGKIKRTIGSVQKEISEELRVEEMRQAAKQQQEKLEQGVGTLNKPFHESLREEMLSKSESKPSSEAPAAETKADPGKSAVE
ncbi:MAG: Sec-independent protein translocase protein TatB [Halopseudomonas sp.]